MARRLVADGKPNPVPSPPVPSPSPTPPIRTLLADDEPLARERLRTLLADAPGFQVIAEAEDGDRAVEAILTLDPDLVFLDIAMPGLDGFGVVETVGPAQMPVLVFVTAYDEHALRAFEVHAVDYLLKPFDRERFTATLRKARAAVEQRRAGERLRTVEALLQEMRPQRGYPQRLAVKQDGKIVFVVVRDIDWIDAAGNYVRLNTREGSFKLRETLSGIEERLDPERFVRIHRSTIVQVERIREIEPVKSGELRLRLEGGQRLTVSRSHRERVERLLA